MRLNEIRFTDALPVDGYGPGFFRIGGEVHEGAVLVAPEGVQAWGGFDDTATLLALAGQLDVLFIGTGGETAHLPEGFRAALEAAGLGVEAMNSPAAARTYNVLISEGRRVGAALLPVAAG
ncbi:Mth938-like domain-containing protein [Pseudoruegeria sp. SHC-113]|uniref:Mth938-like domain-containing protein n=1 Tax=Pseudoruegeria sp. SHC-113 TaxID=2855439 RepID=UPI0021BB6BDE|nr:Mth938-like domain-containing protein [Pseudoruegeria sp. SHC-113]MCT8160057.1 Mth938-like domain-containing protein [Pseudoruegeria sp. SHC-113]